jgi:hypothetical protein
MAPLTAFHYAYLAATLPLLVIWIVFYALRKDIRKEMLVVSILVGLLSVITAHYWWTIDWWKPATITGTVVGIEDFLAGFGSGGIIAVAYEVLFRKRLYHTRTKAAHQPSAFTVLLLIAFLMSWLFWGVGLTSFWASTVAMIAAAAVLFYFRRDLFLNGVLSGVLMAAISSLSYFTIMFLSPEWIPNTYLFDTLSGHLLLGVPIEEFVFWFFAGLVFGPFYEYWQGERCRKMVQRRGR